MRPAAVLGLELQTIAQPGPRVLAGVGTGSESDSAITGVPRPSPEALREYCLKVRDYVPDVVVAGNLSSTVRVAAEIGASWVTTGGLKKTGVEKLRMFERLHQAWKQSGGSGDVFALVDPHEPSPWADATAMQDLLARWGDLGVDELVTWPPETYSETPSLSYAAAAEIAATTVDA
jgi:alkanesulfonate monooxygenase SsuD/methylene tetrahydromethanopterin reductase-like flavin-dependent oxidoreductase (luciferase family)